MLECADCHTRIPEEVERCPRCGGRLLAPPGLLERRAVLVALYAALGSVFAAFLLARWGIYFLAFVDRALDFFGLSPRGAGAAQRRERLADMLRDAERRLPPYPGSARLGERQGQNLRRTAPVLDACWQAPAPFETVLAFYRQELRAASWHVYGETGGAQQLGAERELVHLLIHRPGDGAVPGLECPSGTTYVVSLAVMERRRPT